MRMLLLIAVFLLLAACQPAESPANDSSTAVAAEQAKRVPFALNEMQAQGQVIYETVCWTCHGTSGRGDGPAVKAGSIVAPPTFHAEEYTKATPEQLRRRFRIGPGEADPNHPHMQYVASLLKPERFAEALSFIPFLAYPPEIPGSALAGEALYDYRCSGCHGDSGRGDGPASASLVQKRPADFTADTLIAARNWDAVYNRIREGGRQVHGSAMPPWGIALDEAEMWDLVAYLATFQEGVLSAPPGSD
jgi:mono/diheme cytochrome c family protein